MSRPGYSPDWHVKIHAAFNINDIFGMSSESVEMVKPTK